jgi:restriction system protein
MEFNIEESIEKVRAVGENTRYWFIRTDGGTTYTDFIKHNYVGIGFNNVPQKYIGRKDSDIKNFREYIDSKDSTRDLAKSRWINQLIDFQHTIRIGDVAVIHDSNSGQFTVGVVESDAYLVEDNRAFLYNRNDEAYPEKRRKIKWEHNIIGSNTSELKDLINAPQAISRADNYADIIEGFVSSAIFDKIRCLWF